MWQHVCNREAYFFYNNENKYILYKIQVNRRIPNTGPPPKIPMQYEWRVVFPRSKRAEYSPAFSEEDEDSVELHYQKEGKAHCGLPFEFFAVYRQIKIVEISIP